MVCKYCGKESELITAAAGRCTLCTYALAIVKEISPDALEKIIREVHLQRFMAERAK